MGIGLAIGAALTSLGVGAATATVLAGFIVSAGTSLILGALSSALLPKPKAPRLENLSGFSAKASALTQNIKQPISIRRIIYGEVRVGGALTFIETTGDDKFLHLVISVADHEVEDMQEVWFNEVVIPNDFLDGSGNVIDGDFSGKARIKKHFGEPTQVADSDLVSETSVTSDFRGRGVAYIYVRLEYDRDIFPGGIPNITVWTKGKKILDPRDATTRWTANGALFNYDYLTLPLDDLTPGAGVDTVDVDETFLNASSNVCDEMVDTVAIVETVSSIDTATDIITVGGLNNRLQLQTGDRVQVTTSGTLPSGISALTDYFVIPYQRKDNPRILLATTLANALAGTSIVITDEGTGTHDINKNAEPRYYGGGVVETSENIEGNLEDLLTIMNGNAIYIGGSWKIRAGAFSTPVFDFDEDHLLTPLNVKTKVSRRDRFNLIKGVYVTPLNDGEPADYPSVTNSTYVTNDGGRTIPIDFDLPMTQRPHTAQRIAKIKLEKHRQELFFEASFNLHAMQVQPGDTIRFSNVRMGWSLKEFEVVTWALEADDIDGVPVFSVKMSLQETASAVYDWNSGEETQVDPAPDTNLPNPLIVFAPTSLSVTPIEVRTASGDLAYEFLIDWDASASTYVVNGGHYEVQFKQTAQVDFNTSVSAIDGDTDILVKLVNPGINYDCRVRSVSLLGVRSPYSSLFGFTVESPSGATIVIDFLQITGPVIDSTDFEGVADATDDTNDYGSLT